MSDKKQKPILTLKTGTDPSRFEFVFGPYNEAEPGNWQDAPPLKTKYGKKWPYTLRVIEHDDRREGECEEGEEMKLFATEQQHLRLCTMNPQRGDEILIFKEETDDGKSRIRIGFPEDREDDERERKQPRQARAPRQAQEPRATRTGKGGAPRRDDSDLGVRLVEGWLHFHRLASLLVPDAEDRRTFIGNLFIEWNKQRRPPLPPIEAFEEAEPEAPKQKRKPDPDVARQREEHDDVDLPEDDDEDDIPF